MILRDAVDNYIDRRQAHGAKFDAGAYLLHRFLKHIGGSARCDAVSQADVLDFLAGKGPLTRYRASKYGALAGFYRYAISRGYVIRSPLPARDDEPARPRSSPPYVYSRNELQRLFDAIDVSRQRSIQLDADTLRALLLLLYGAGLRFAEAQRLTLGDVDLPDALLTIRNTKFYKTRLVPVRGQLADALNTYAAKRAERPLPKGTASTFLANRDGTPVVQRTAGHAFTKLLRDARIGGGNDGRRTPCPHSPRHAAAVHRLESRYRQGADVQRLLPTLSIWLGHTDLNGTRIYLSMTPELPHRASIRFDAYVNRGGNHE
ncbi:tyrosine-type recombinase/integrase [Candidatus Palauibacter sp.]|uniref:tyrosine-type recombinase/integrase n=1 Tax=Candidatus Palauibacter sp. TaxID=3101350 RepID=UPI003B5BD88D